MYRVIDLNPNFLFKLQTAAYWTEIETQAYMFDRVFREIETVKAISLQDIISQWNTGMVDVSKRQCLNVQVTSQVTSESNDGHMNFTPIQSEKDILPMHDSLEEWQLPPLPPKTELEKLGLQRLYVSQIAEEIPGNPS